LDDGPWRRLWCAALLHNLRAPDAPEWLASPSFTMVAALAGLDAAAARDRLARPGALRRWRACG
jgi:hypothetical protein